MRPFPWIAVFIGLSILPLPAVGQRDVSCPGTLRPRFDNYQPVVFRGKPFETYWQNTAGGALGGPSYAWFVATPEPNPLSLDGTMRWRGARILVHCYATLLWGGSRTYHYHPVAYDGVLESVRTSCGITDDPPTWDDGGEYVTSDSVAGPVLEEDTEPLTRLTRDPDREGAPSDTYMMDCGGTGDGDGGTGDVTCHWEYLTIEISYDGGRSWAVLWEGWGQVCEENAS